MRVLFVSANSPRAYIDIEREHRTLRSLLESCGHSLRSLPGAELSDLRGALEVSRRRACFDVLHYSGHATHEDGLLLRAPGRQSEPLSAETLAAMLEGTGIKLVLLNACLSHTAAAAIGAVVPAAIGALQPLRDVVARRFSEDFYRALTEHATVRQAFETALRSRRRGTAPYVQTGTDPDIVLAASSATMAGPVDDGQQAQGTPSKRGIAQVKIGEPANLERIASGDSGNEAENRLLAHRIRAK